MFYGIPYVVATCTGCRAERSFPGAGISPILDGSVPDPPRKPAFGQEDYVNADVPCECGERRLAVVMYPGDEPPPESGPIRQG